MMNAGLGPVLRRSWLRNMVTFIFHCNCTSLGGENGVTCNTVRAGALNNGEEVKHVGCGGCGVRDSGGFWFSTRLRILERTLSRTVPF